MACAVEQFPACSLLSFWLLSPLDVFSPCLGWRPSLVGWRPLFSFLSSLNEMSFVLILIANIVTSSKALVTTSVAPVSSNMELWSIFGTGTVWSFSVAPRPTRVCSSQSAPSNRTFNGIATSNTNLVTRAWLLKKKLLGTGASLLVTRSY